MKRLAAIFLCVSLLFLAGCGAQPEKAAGAAPAEIKVNTVDEFLAALGSDRTILLEPGTYDLSKSTTYGTEDTGESYRWESVFDGYELVLTAVQNLTIRGSARDAVTISTDPRNAAVITLDNCADVCLDSLTAGHNFLGQNCEGPVVRLQSCLGTEFHQVGLYGCGATGVEARDSREILLDNSEIYDCSSTGLYLYNCANVTAVNTDFRDIGKDGIGWTVIGSSSGSDVTLSRCTVRGCLVNSILYSWNSQNFKIQDTTFADNTLWSSFFELYDSEILLEDNIFADEPAQWYVPNSGCAVDAVTGEVFMPNVPTPSHESKEPAQAVSVSTGKQKTVKAATVDEFLAALGSNTEILLTGKLYDLTAASDYGTTGGKYYYWEDCFDGPQLVIKGVQNLTIRGAGKDSCTVSTEPRYANVLTFRSCANVELTGITAGHTKEPGQCAGGVISLESCRECLVNECGLFGCGILGVSAMNSQALQVINTDIYECSYGGIQMTNCQGVTVGGCSFRDLGGPVFQFYDVADAVIEGDSVESYYFGN